MRFSRYHSERHALGYATEMWRGKFLLSFLVVPSKAADSVRALRHLTGSTMLSPSPHAEALLCILEISREALLSEDVITKRFKNELSEVSGLSLTEQKSVLPKRRSLQVP